MSSAKPVTFLKVAGAIVIVAALLFVSVVPFSNPGRDLQVGDIASRTIRAPRDIAITSETLTAKRQDEAAAAVEPTLTFDPGVAVTQQAQLNGLLVRIRNIVDDPSLSPVAKGAALDRVDNLDISSFSSELLEQMPPDQLLVVETESRRALASIFEQSLPQELVGETRERASTYVSPTLDRDMSTLVAEIVRPFIVTNLTIDQAKTDAAKDAARAGVAPFLVSFAQNQVIVEQDSPVTPEAHEALIAAGVISQAWKPELLGAAALLSTVVAGAVAAGWRAFRPAGRARQLLGIGTAIAIPVFIMKLYLPMVLPDQDRHFLTYVVPIAVSSMVLAGFIGAEVALLAAAAIALLVAFSAVLLLDVTVVGIAGPLDITALVLASGIAGAAGVFAVRKAERLVQFLLGGFVVFASIFTTLAAIWLIDPNSELTDLPWILGTAAANGLLSAFLSAGIFVTLGALLGVTTRLQLLEMSQLSSPLLLRLQEEAPSTFQHSVVVANLAEKGAHVIGADSLLARVGCYYHDIGKLVRPGFFIENQLGGANPHDLLDPVDSARIISDHVTDGLMLAEEHQLPAQVAAFIPEHHGTRVVLYFYRLASKEDPDVDPDLFRYPGPKPQSRETAIAMLADSCEATVRSNPDHSAEKIDAIVDEVFNERLTEGQLDESDLTLKDLRAVAASFKATLQAIYHPRIEYPAPTEAEMFLRRLPFRGASQRN